MCYVDSGFWFVVCGSQILRFGIWNLEFPPARLYKFGQVPKRVRSGGWNLGLNETINSIRAFDIRRKEVRRRTTRS